jgi:hypothetical protein
MTSLVQYRTAKNERAVAAIDANGQAARVANIASTYALASHAISKQLTLCEAVQELGMREEVDIADVTEHDRLLPPIDHEEPARLYLTGTGLTHLGSAEGRDSMHRATSESSTQTDSMKMFLMGVQGGKPKPGETGVQPEWFYKGNGWCVATPGGPIISPAFASDAGEEAEIAGIYLIAPDGSPVRLGFSLANEFSDHVTERGNYLWLAHSKLRQVGLGPELLTGKLPRDVRGITRILRNGEVIWEKQFLSGEDNMSHSIENLEQHHFKYSFFRRPGDVHVHFFGTATASFSDGIATQPGDVFEIHAEHFRLPLRNILRIAAPEQVSIRSL